MIEVTLRRQSLTLNTKLSIKLDILLDMEKEIKSYLGDIQNSNYSSGDDYKFMKPCGYKCSFLITKTQIIQNEKIF